MSIGGPFKQTRPPVLPIDLEFRSAVSFAPTLLLGELPPGTAMLMRLGFLGHT